MFTRYFDTCNSIDEVKTLYRTLALQNHPDHGGDLRTMQEINAQYAEAQVYWMKHNERARQQEAHAQGKKTTADFNDLDAIGEELKARIEWALNNLPADVTVELCGLWVWLTGNTRPNAEAIKNSGLGFKFASQKKAWFFAGCKSFGRGKYSMDDIRSMHGSTTFSKFNGRKAEEQEEQPAELPAYA